MVFRRLILMAVAVALLVGTLQVIVQQWTALPIIQAAESYEAKLYRAGGNNSDDSQTAGTATAAGDTSNARAASVLTDRLLWTWVANILMSFALAVLVFSTLGFYARGHQHAPPAWRLAVAIAVTGFIGFFLWPSLGMPPEIPGMDSARLGSRQLWWLLAAGCAILACLSVFLLNAWTRWMVAAVLLVVPYLLGPPAILGDPFARFDIEATVHMMALSREFIYASAIGSALHWLLLGIACSATFVRWLLPLLRETGQTQVA